MLTRLGNKHTGFLGLWQLKSGLDKQEIRQHYENSMFNKENRSVNKKKEESSHHGLISCCLSTVYLKARSKSADSNQVSLVESVLANMTPRWGLVPVGRVQMESRETKGPTLNIVFFCNTLLLQMGVKQLNLIYIWLKVGCGTRPQSGVTF